MPAKPQPFDVEAFLHSSGVARTVREYRVGAAMFAQGAPAESVIYIQRGAVRLSVLSRTGREAVVAMLGPGDFVGEGALAGQTVRIASAKAVAATTALVIEAGEMLRVLHTERDLSDRFISHVLTRNIRVEEDLVDQLFNSSEKRLARALLLLARYGGNGQQPEPHRSVPRRSRRRRSRTWSARRGRASTSS